MSHPSREKNVGFALDNHSRDVEHHVYWPGKTILKLYLVRWTPSLLLESMEYNHVL